VEEGRWKRSSTLELTLFTFCPPAPEARVKDIVSLSSGMGMELGISENWAEVEKLRRIGGLRFGGGLVW